MIKLVNESLEDIFQGPSEEEFNIHLKQYAQAFDKMDKFMSDEDPSEFYEIIDSDDDETTKIDELVDFLNISVQDEVRMISYFPEDGNITEFATYLVRNAG